MLFEGEASESGIGRLRKQNGLEQAGAAASWVSCKTALRLETDHEAQIFGQLLSHRELVFDPRRHSGDAQVVKLYKRGLKNAG